MRKFFVALGIVFVSLAIPTAAWAHDCINLSRQPGSAPFEGKGKWTYLPEGVVPIEGGAWGFDNPEGFGGNSGHGHVLLDGSGACSTARLTGQTQGSLSPNDAKGIWSGECYEAALP